MHLCKKGCKDHLIQTCILHSHLARSLWPHRRNGEESQTQATGQSCFLGYQILWFIRYITKIMIILASFHPVHILLQIVNLRLCVYLNMCHWTTTLIKRASVWDEVILFTLASRGKKTVLRFCPQMSWCNISCPFTSLGVLWAYQTGKSDLWFSEESMS